MDGEGFKLGLGEEGYTIRSTEVKPRDWLAPSEVARLMEHMCCSGEQ